MRQIEKVASEMRKNGSCKKWFEEADPDDELMKVSGSVNGPMLQLLAESIKYHDMECVDMFRVGRTSCLSFAVVCFMQCDVSGAELVGKLEPRGNGEPIIEGKGFDCGLVDTGARERNLRVSHCCARGCRE